MALPTISFSGNLTNFPELRTTANGKMLVSLRVACNDRYKNDSGEWVNGETTYVDVVSWRNAEAINNTLEKGSRVFVVGTLKQREYETKSGETRTAYEVNAQDVAQIIYDKTPVGAATLQSFGAKPVDDDPWSNETPF